MAYHEASISTANIWAPAVHERHREHIVEIEPGDRFLLMLAGWPATFENDQSVSQSPEAGPVTAGLMHDAVA